MSDRGEAKGLVDFLIDSGVLIFGNFRLKSGRESPYFFNLGSINTGVKTTRLAEAYADRILEAGIAFDLLFGPAYKGIPLVVSTAEALARRGYDVGWAFNRKEVKPHGEGGHFVGAEIGGKILLVDDVLTAGSAIRESISLLKHTDAELAGVIVTMDRQECLSNKSAKTAVQQIEEELKVPVLSLLNLDDVIAFFKKEPETQINSASILSRLQEYRDEYGVN
ncbi:MAG: orotate phosphoribosyltransferase [Gammaproteobacteria bacterium]|nr:orotate phosphoribosyltransferase [Gammaproteobacteria bacterium]|tara:strand:+ start:549 stop:1214 length:666 start_codon:yes stop_codon:yes gene_type:complete